VVAAFCHDLDSSHAEIKPDETKQSIDSRHPCISDYRDHIRVCGMSDNTRVSAFSAGRDLGRLGGRALDAFSAGSARAPSAGSASGARASKGNLPVEPVSSARRSERRSA